MTTQQALQNLDKLAAACLNPPLNRSAHGVLQESVRVLQQMIIETSATPAPEEVQAMINQEGKGDEPPEQ